MKHIQFFFFFIVLFIASVNTYAQTPERVLSAEEFRQRIIEEKRQQLRRVIQVSENDRMTILYDTSVVLSKPYVKVLVFLGKEYKTTSKIRDMILSDKKTDLTVIFENTNNELNKMFLLESRKIIDYLFNISSPLNRNERAKIFNAHFESLVQNFNKFLAASPENREKVAQAIRDYRLEEYIKIELPVIEAERNVSTGNYRFIGFTIGIGLAKSYSDKYDYYAPVSSGDHSVIPIFNVDANFRYMNLYRINSDFHIGFIVDFGIWCEFIENSIQFLGSDLMLGMKFERLLVGIGGYIYFRVSKWDNDNSIFTQLKTIDIGLMFSLNYLLGSRMNYLLGLDIRVNLNKFVIHKSDEVGHVSILFKFGYGF